MLDEDYGEDRLRMTNLLSDAARDSWKSTICLLVATALILASLWWPAGIGLDKGMRPDCPLEDWKP